MKRNHLTQLAALLMAGAMILTGVEEAAEIPRLQGSSTAGKPRQPREKPRGAGGDHLTYWGSGAEKTAIEASVKTFEKPIRILR